MPLSIFAHEYVSWCITAEKKQTYNFDGLTLSSFLLAFKAHKSLKNNVIFHPHTSRLLVCG